MTAKNSSTEPEAVKVKVLVDNHTHRGELVKPGAIIELDAKTADWLIGLGVAQKEA